jgi:thioredoxin 1
MASPNVTDITDATFEAEVLNSPVPVLVDFWATWCGPCKAIAPAIEQVANDNVGKLKVVKVDIDRNRAIAARMGITGVPTLLVFKAGQVVQRKVGSAGGLNGIKALVEPAISG